MAQGSLPPFLQLDEEARLSRLDFLEIGPEDRALLAELGALLQPHHEALIDRWYEFLLARPETRDLLGRARTRSHLQGAQAHYFRGLFRGPYDQAYFENRLKIGFVHEKVGLEPAWYMGAYRKYQDVVRTFLREQGVEAARIVPWMRALEKVVLLDTELALDAYFDTFNRGLVEANTALRAMTGQLERHNRELSRQIERAQEADRLKHEFLSRVSHELRTPLNSVLGYADLLLDGIDGPLTEAQRESIEKIRRQGGTLLGLIDRMIETAKMTVAGLSAPLPFDAAAAVERVAEAAREAAQGKGLRFDVEIEPGLPRAVGDEPGFELALSHLVENAVKFTLLGSVRLEARSAGDAVRFTVADTGPGIPAEHLARIFEPFHQVDSGDTRTATGLGIGLTLARHAVERMNGSLRIAESGPGGSVFVLEIPAENLRSENNG